MKFLIPLERPSTHWKTTGFSSYDCSFASSASRYLENRWNNAQWSISQLLKKVIFAQRLRNQNAQRFVEPFFWIYAKIVFSANKKYFLLVWVKVRFSKVQKLLHWKGFYGYGCDSNVGEKNCRTVDSAFSFIAAFLNRVATCINEPGLSIIPSLLNDVPNLLFNCNSNSQEEWVASSVTIDIIQHIKPLSSVLFRDLPAINIFETNIQLLDHNVKAFFQVGYLYCGDAYELEPLHFITKISVRRKNIR